MQEQDHQPDSLLNWYRTLLALRQARPELRHGDQRILCDDDSAVLCILREADGRQTLLIANLGSTSAKPALGEQIGRRKWIDLINRDKTDNKQIDPASLSLAPMSIRILGTP